MAADFSNLSGKTIKGYELREMIGHGGFGAVYRAYQPSVDREVALKLILPEHANQPDFIRRFESEAQVVARLEHPHITPLYDYWREPGMAILVMRLLRGGSLQDSIERNGAWQPANVVRLVDQIAGALTTAHRNNIIHRDLKPANILLDEEGNAYLADFGIAKQLNQPQTLPPEDDRYGSPAFISPEQVIGQPVSPQTDIYSLGMVIFVTLTGQTPFFDSNTDTVIRKQLSDTLPPIQTLRADLPYAINIIMWRATSKRPEARYPDAYTLANDLKQVLAPDSTTSVMAQISTPSIPRILSNPPNANTVMLEPVSGYANPYKGLKAFQEVDETDFFGRKDLIERLINRLAQNEKHNQFLAIIGPSGSGKSSIVLAGLVPALKRGALFGSQEWFYVQFTPSTDPLQQLADALLSIAATTPTSLTDLFGADDEALTLIIPKILPVDNSELVLIIDQFEEIFTLVADEEIRARFLALLVKAATTPTSRLKIIITLRADFYDRPLQYAGLSELMRDNTEIILPLSLPDMEEAIIQPAARYGIQFEHGLVPRIINDVNQQPGALPLLQFALTELFDKREGYLLKIDSYAKAGGVLGSLARRAEELYTSLDSFSQAAAQQMFLRLVSLSDGAEDTRRRVTRMELNIIASDKTIVQNVIDEFGKHRLLTFDFEAGTRTPTVEIAHEALIRVWDRLREWLQSSREELRLHRRLSIAATEWVNTGKDKSFLPSGARLVQFESLAVSPIIKLTANESAFIWAAVAARQKASQRLRNILIGVSVAAILAIALAIFAFDRQNVAETQTKRANTEAVISRSRELAVTALRSDNRLDLALLLSLESLNTANTFEARNSLVTNLETKPQLTHFLTAHTDTIRALAYSPNGRFLASAGKDQSIILWDTQTNRPIGQPLKGHSNWINALAFSPDSQTLLSVSIDGTIRRWDVTNGQTIGDPLNPNSTELWSVAFDPNGKAFVTGDKDGTILMWDIASGKPVGKPLTGHTDLIYALAYSPDGKMFASASGDGTIRLWNAENGQPVGDPLAEHRGSVLAIAFSPDGQRLASTGIDDTVILWDPSTGEYIDEFPTGHTKRVKALAFSNDGSLLATASDDNTVRLWDTQTWGQVGQDLTGYSDHIWSMAFDPKNQSLAVASADNAIMIWDLAAYQPLIQAVIAQPSNVLAAVFSPSGNQFASGGGSKGNDSLIHIWDASTNNELRTLPNIAGYITELVYSPDGSKIVSASSNNSLGIWDITTAKQLRVINLTGDNRYIPVAYSTDGKTIASGNSNGDIELWDANTGQQIGNTLKGHSGAILSLAFRGDGILLASASADKTVMLWDVSSQQPTGKPLTGHTDEVWAVKFSPNNQLIATGSTDHTIRLWDASTHEPVGQPLIGHTDRVKSLDFTPDGSMLISGSQDNTIILWDVTQKLPVGRPLVGHTNFINALSISPDGNTLISAGEDNQLIKWDISSNGWRKTACSIANRNFSISEWERYFSDLAFVPTCPNIP
ncbi:MAG: protein kinase [Anaerolineaceae bacterium]|nr:protein kinase [Anaerolineaceae bacterium]